MQSARPAIPTQTASLRPGSQPPTAAVYPTNQPIMMTMAPMPFPSPQPAQYYIPQVPNNNLFVCVCVCVWGHFFLLHGLHILFYIVSMSLYTLPFSIATIHRMWDLLNSILCSLQGLAPSTLVQGQGSMQLHIVSNSCIMDINVNDRNKRWSQNNLQINELKIHCNLWKSRIWFDWCTYRRVFYPVRLKLQLIPQIFNRF